VLADDGVRRCLPALDEDCALADDATRTRRCLPAVGHRKVGGVCQPIATSGLGDQAPSRMVWLELGAEVPMATFAAVP
jgi:hypothetical protein